MRELFLAFFLSVACCACESGDETQSSDETSRFTPLPEGAYLYTLEVSSLSGLTLPFQLNLKPNQAERSFEEITLRAVDSEGETSEILDTLENIIVGDSDDFSFRFAAVTLPGAFVPTGSDIQVDIVSQATIASDSTFCGTVSGEVTSLGLSLDGSFFGTKQWDGEVDGPSSCEAGVLTDLERIDEESCPELSSGTNLEFISGLKERSFELALPRETQAAPLVFVFHGFGGNGEQMMRGGAEDLAESLGAVVVAPDGLLKGNETSWDTFKPQAQNEDITFFDDLLTCLVKQYQINESRVYATGMSFGGVMTGTLMVERPDFLAAVAPMSGGIVSGNLEQDNDGQLCLPALVLWGGEEDVAFEQDFDLLSEELVEELMSVEAPTIACNHGGGHVIPPDAFEQVSAFFDYYDGSNPCEQPNESLQKTLGTKCEVQE